MSLSNKVLARLKMVRQQAEQIPLSEFTVSDMPHIKNLRKWRLMSRLNPKQYDKVELKWWERKIEHFQRKEG